MYKCRFGQKEILPLPSIRECLGGRRMRWGINFVPQNLFCFTCSFFFLNQYSIQISLPTMLCFTHVKCYNICSPHSMPKLVCCCCCQVISVVSDSVRPHRRQPTRLLCPWDSPGKNTGVGCHFLLQCMKVKSESEVVQSCPTLQDPMDCSLPGSSVHGIFQAKVLGWVAIAFSIN